MSLSNSNEQCPSPQARIEMTLIQWHKNDIRYNNVETMLLCNGWFLVYTMTLGQHIEITWGRWNKNDIRYFDIESTLELNGWLLVDSITLDQHRVGLSVFKHTVCTIARVLHIARYCGYNQRQWMEMNAARLWSDHNLYPKSGQIMHDRMTIT